MDPHSLLSPSRPSLRVQLRPQLLQPSLNSSNTQLPTCVPACACVCVCAALLARFLQAHSLHLGSPVMLSLKQHLEGAQIPLLVNCDSRSFWAL